MVSEEMARCIAKISGDGYLYHRYIRYSNQCKELIDEFKQDILKEFGPLKITEGISNSGTPFAQIHGKSTINRFLSYLKDYRSFYIHIPDEIKNSNLETKRQFIRAFYDDEGSPSLRLYYKCMEWKRGVSFSSNSFRLLEEIKEILFEDFKIMTNNISMTNKNREDDKSYVLNISGKENIQKYRDEICFLSPNKIKKLDLIIDSYGCGYVKNSKGFKRTFNEYNKLMKKSRTAF